MAYCASIVEARTSPTGNPFGSVQGGHIHIRGYLCTIRKKASQFYPVWDVVSVNGEHRQENSLRASNGLIFFILLIEKKSLRSHSFLTRGLLLDYTGDKKGQYKRIGCFRAFGSHLLQTSRSSHPAKQLYMDVNGKKEYTVEII